MTDGITVLDRPEQIEAFRLLTLRSALRMETRGMKMTRGRSALSIVREQYGVKARSSKAALPEFEALLVEWGVIEGASA